MSCVHDGGFGSSIGCARCNADLAALIDAPPCGVSLGTMNGVELRCDLQRGHFGDHSHTFKSTLYAGPVPGGSGRIGKA